MEEPPVEEPREERALTANEEAILSSLRQATRLYSDAYARCGWCGIMRAAIRDHLDTQPELISPTVLLARFMAPTSLSPELIAEQESIRSMLQKVSEAEPMTTNGSTLSARYATTLNTYRSTSRDIGTRMHMPGVTNDEMQTPASTKADQLLRCAEEDHRLAVEVEYNWRMRGFLGNFSDHDERQKWSQEITAAGNVSPTSWSEVAYRPSDREWESSADASSADGDVELEWEMCDICGDKEIGATWLHV